MKAKISESLLALLESASETKALLPALLVREPTLAIEGTGDLIDAFPAPAKTCSIVSVSMKTTTPMCTEDHLSS